MSITAVSNNSRRRRILFGFPDGSCARFILGRVGFAAGAKTVTAFGITERDYVGIPNDQHPWFWQTLPDKMTGEELSAWVTTVSKFLHTCHTSNPTWQSLYQACYFGGRGLFDGTIQEFKQWLLRYVSYFRRLKHGYRFVE